MIDDDVIECKPDQDGRSVWVKKDNDGVKKEEQIVVNYSEDAGDYNYDNNGDVNDNNVINSINSNNNSQNVNGSNKSVNKNVGN